jgi:elongation factor 2
MPHFRQTAEILKLMSNKERIRNVGIVAHIDHGKTTMTDSLLVEAGLLPPQVAGTARVLDYLEEEQKRGITIKTANISLLHETDGQSYVINLIDTPGHVDFTGKVTRALRAIDGVVVVVDAVEEVMAQTETVTRQALEERVKPVLYINKVDRLIKELKFTAGEIQKKFTHIIEEFNGLIEAYGETEFKSKWQVDPAEDSVAFGSALHKWGFTLSMTQQKRIKIADIIAAYSEDKLQRLSKSLPLHDAILDMTVRNCPNPIEAQKCRIPKIWKGKINSEIGKTMLKCNDNGPTVMCITNTQIDPKAGVVATGRLFSGSVKTGDHVHLVGVDKEYTVQQVSMYMGQYREAVSQITAGNIAALTGLELARAGETLVDILHTQDMVPFERMKYVSEPVITVAIEPKNPEDLSRLGETMNRLSLEDPNLAITINEKTGEYLLSGMGELHLETAIKFLKEYSNGIDITTSNPTADYRETVTTKGLIVMAKSPNKQNCFWVQVKPHETDAQNILASDEQENVLIDLTGKMDCLSEVKNMIVSGFRWACKTGPLCEQPMRRVKIKLMNAEISEDPALREPTQITRATSRAILGSFLTAKPTLLEPIYKIEVSTSTQWFGTCTNIITRRRGKIQDTQNRGNLTMITGYIPVAQTFGLSTEIRSATSGHAFWQCTFDHWQKIPESIATEIIKQIRMQRGLSSETPKPDKFIDEKG